MGSEALFTKIEAYHGLDGKTTFAGAGLPNICAGFTARREKYPAGIKAQNKVRQKPLEILASRRRRWQ